jgi:hypothetical protein
VDRLLVERRLKCATEVGAIEQQTSNLGRIITIVNYDKYQLTDDEEQTASQTSNEQQDEHQMNIRRTRIGEVREIREEREHAQSPPAEADRVKPPRTKKPKERIITWDESDPLAPAFENLKAFPKYLAIFVLEKVRKTLQSHMDHHKLSVSDLVTVTRDLMHWADGPNEAKVESPRGTLNTFIKNHAQRLAKQPKKSELKIWSGDINELV